jgi:DNA polymerase III sliding clamp (beta) subunit (PCNA family)
MIVDRNKLKNALAIVKPGLAQKEDIAQTTSFAFIDGYVVTYNDKISIRHPVEGIVKIQGAVEAESLYKLIDRLTKDEVEIDLDDNEDGTGVLVVKCGRAKAGLAIQSDIVLPLQELEGKKEWQELAEDFSVGVNFVSQACAKDTSRPILNCVHVSPLGYIEASDGHRIARYNMANYTFAQDYLLHVQDALPVATLCPTYIAWGNGWVHYKTNEDTIISCRLFNGAFPEIDAHLEITEGVPIGFPQKVLEVLSRAQVFSKREDSLSESVTIAVGKNRFTMKSRSDTGWFEEELNFKYDGKAIEFSVTPNLLKDVLTETLEGELGKDRLKFTTEKWVYLTLLRG